ncbi:Sorbose reductase SOU1 [Penicillium chermesinum]|nr:Sorbose reductase SOU1 [Penicillium chermesinum]
MEPITTIHKTVYDGINAALPSQCQRGKTVLITGGAGGIGFAIARAFAIANASHLILLGTRPASPRKSNKTPTTRSSVVLGSVVELADPDSLECVWKNVLETSLAVDVLILNAAYMGESQDILQNGWRQVWEQYEVNVRGNLTLVDKFVRQTQVEGRSKKFIVDVTSDAINNYEAMEGQRPYAATKAAWTCLLQHIAFEIPVSDVQIINMHPGGIYTDTIAQMLPRDCYEWDNGAMHFFDPIHYAPANIDTFIETLPGNFAVWAATNEAAFLHGRYCWAGWDIEEMRKKLGDKELANQQFLRVGVIGVKDAVLQE